MVVLVARPVVVDRYIIRKKDFINIFNKNKPILSMALALLIQISFVPIQPVYAYSNPATVPLGTVENFAALAHTAVSSPLTGTTLNNGDLGIEAGCTDFPTPCTTPGSKGTVIGGVIHNEDGTVTTGQTDATAAVTNIGLRSASATLLAQLGGQTLTQGVYDVPDAATNLTGDLTLNGDADSVFIFRMEARLITDSGSRVILGPGVQACNVFWKVGSSATFNGTTTMVGTVLASASVSFPGGGATLNGRAIAQSAAITFNNTTVNNTSCSGGSGGSDSSSSSGSSSDSDRCVAITPTKPQWALVSPANGGTNLSWSAMGGSKVDIEITNGKGEFEYKYSKVPNIGHMFLPNVASSQKVRIRTFNLCTSGDWVTATASPGLPNTGLGPQSNKYLLYFIVGIVSSIVLIQRKYIFSLKK